MTTGPGTVGSGSEQGAAPGASVVSAAAVAAPAPADGPSAAAEVDPSVLAQLVAEAVTAHPAVARLDGGPFGTVATYLPGRRLVGVHVGRPGEPVELAVVLFLDRPIPNVVRALRETVAALCAGVPVDITVTDVELPDETVYPGTAVDIGP